MTEAVLQGSTWIDSEQKEAQSMLVRWTIAFLYVSKCHLREDSDVEQDLQVRLACMHVVAG